MCQKNLKYKKKNIAGYFKLFLKRFRRLSQKRTASLEFHNFHFAVVSFTQPTRLERPHGRSGSQSTKPASLSYPSAPLGPGGGQRVNMPKAGSNTHPPDASQQRVRSCMLCAGAHEPPSLQAVITIRSQSRPTREVLHPHLEGKGTNVARPGLRELDTFGALGRLPHRPSGDGCRAREGGKGRSQGKRSQMCLARE